MKPIDAITRIDASSRRNTVTVDFDDEKIELDDVFEALSEAGYSVTRFEKIE